jgi:hypothetical protein
VRHTGLEYAYTTRNGRWYYRGPEQQVLVSLEAIALDTHPNFRSRTKEGILVVFDRFHDEFSEDGQIE